jgi:NADH-quinone oxidoreductase subunit L
LKLLHIFSIAPFAPLLAAFVIGIFGKKLPKFMSYGLTVLAVTISLLISIYTVYITSHGFIFNQTLYQWLSSGSYTFEIGFLIDNLTALMMVVVTFVSLMVHIYTIGYMKDDPGFSRFFSYISLFTFSMLMLVMSNNFLQLFFGWEAVGLVSYLLIGFWFNKPTAVHANLKAFLVNRVGDIGLLLGIALVLFWFGTLDYATVFDRLELLSGEKFFFSEEISVSVISLICILLFIGAMGKSAQIPLHVWLPDSMEGPTPISALIHAATMVTAGIFMVARMSPLFELSSSALSFITIIGSLTALMMGILGIFQNDIKKVIAYSTISQLGYMTVAMGVSAYSVGIFHLMTHAFFKALLFLAAGSVIIGMHHDQDIRNMGGLRRYMPITWITFLIGSLALMGMPFLSGFYSKETIVEAAKHSEILGSNFAYFSLMIGIFITAFYSTRLYYLVFHGEEKWHTHKNETHHGLLKGERPHESSFVITLPLILLAIPSLFIGFFTIERLVYGSFFSSAIKIDAQLHNNMTLLSQNFHGAIAMGLHGLTSLPFSLALGGFLMAWWVYSKNISVVLPRKTMAIINTIIKNNYGFDLINEKYLSKWVKALGQFFYKYIDINLIDHFMVNGTARAVNYLSRTLRAFQSGYIYHYAFIMIIGLFLLITFFVKL